MLVTNPRRSPVLGVHARDRAHRGAAVFWLLARPGITLVAAVLALGLWVLLYGVIQIAIAFDLRRVRERALRLDRRFPEMSTPR